MHVVNMCKSERTGVADGGFSATVRHDREGKRGNGFGQHDGLVAD
jgi:hypothetical protein